METSIFLPEISHVSASLEQGQEPALFLQALLP